jgi:hypothetical protein
MRPSSAFEMISTLLACSIRGFPVSSTLACMSTLILPKYIANVASSVWPVRTILDAHADDRADHHTGAFPTNFLMQRAPLGPYLGINIFLWGFFLIFQGAAQNFAGIAALRALAGAAEACSDPSFMLITWYAVKFCLQSVKNC